MASGRYGPALGQVVRLFTPSGTATALAEGSLLERFARLRDEAAFEALVARHGPMVLGVCRRALDRPDDVEDAFQATFLVLARRAGSIRDGDRLGPWLHGVARRVATRARARSAARRSRERPTLVEPSSSPDAASGLEADELRATLDEELDRLPEKYRTPLVLCYLEGLTHDEAAAHLGWPVGTVRSRLSGGRDRLRSRLARRGLAPSAGFAGVLPSITISEALISTTARIATASGTSIPALVATLAKGALVAMMWNKVMTVATVGLMASCLVGGVGAFARQKGSVGVGTPSSAVPAQIPTADKRMATAPPDASQGSTAPVAESIRIRTGQLINEAVAVQSELDTAVSRIKRLEQELTELKAAMDGPVKPVDRAIKPSPSARPDVGEKSKAARSSKNSSGGAMEGMMGMGGGMMGMGGGMMGMGGGGMGGGRGMASPRSGPITMHLSNEKILMIPSARDRATVLDLNTEERETYPIPEGLTNVNPILGPGVGTLQFEGPKIDQVVAYSLHDGKWHPQDLREPTSGTITPLVGPQQVTYTIGKFMYIFRA